MKHNKEPKLSLLLLAPVDSLDGKEKAREVEGRDEVDHPLLDRAHAKLGRTEDNITDHQDIVFVWISVSFHF